MNPLKEIRDLREPGRTAAPVALMVLLALAGCAKQPQDSAPPPTPVRVQTVLTGASSPSIATNGIVVAKDEMRLAFKVGGVIRRITVQEGDAVKRGDRLAEIELTEIGSQVEQAQQLADKARRDLERGERLYADQVITLERLQDLRTQAALQHAALRSANFNLGYAVITAPRDGVVLRKLAEERELVPAGQPVIVVSARERGYIVRAALSDREIVQVKLGDPAQIRMDAFPGQAIPGTVTEIASAADEKTGLFAIEVKFDTQPMQLASGLVAKLDIQPASSRLAALAYVPIASVVEGDRDRASVFVVDGDHVQRRSIRVAFISPAGVAIAAGVEPGERVVTDGALYLEDGERIAIVRDSGQAVGSLAVPGIG
jgi:multidrug efflux system membrane fusion protein